MLRRLAVAFIVIAALAPAPLRAQTPLPSACAQRAEAFAAIAPPTLAELHARYDDATFTIFSRDYGPEAYYLDRDGRFVVWKKHTQALYRGAWAFRETFTPALQDSIPRLCPPLRKVLLCFTLDGQPMKVSGGPAENPFAVWPENAGCLHMMKRYPTATTRGDVLGLSRMTAPPIALPHQKLSPADLRRLLRR